MPGKFVALSDTDVSAYRVGQRWTYRTRPAEPWSTLIILKIESRSGDENVIHVSLDGLKLNGPQGLSSFVYHLPLAEKALAASTLQVQEERAPLPDYRPGYDRWRKEFERGTADVWSKTVAECLNAIEKMMEGP